MIVMEECATLEEITRVLMEIRKCGLRAVLVEVPCKGFSNRNIKEESKW